MLLLLILPVVFMIFYFNLATVAFQKLGLSPQGALLLLFASIIGSTINIPITRKRIVLADPTAERMPQMLRMFLPVFHYYPPIVAEQVISVNVGGALVPICFSIYLLLQPGTSLLGALLATAAVATIAKLLARPVPGVGITLPGFIPPILAAIVAHLVALVLGMQTGIAPVAYVGGAMGTLIGADLLNLPVVLRGGLLAAGPSRVWRVSGDVPQLPKNQRRILSIGGAGVFDGIFLTGIIAPFLA
jgi:uncharacterized membrane protein